METKRRGMFTATRRELLRAVPRIGGALVVGSALTASVVNMAPAKSKRSRHKSKPKRGEGALGTEAAPVYYGSNFAKVWDGREWHWTVQFFPQPPRFGTWRVTGPFPCSVWPQQSRNYVVAGFRFFSWANPYLVTRPSAFKLYPA